MNADPRRPEKVQRYAPKTNNNGSGQEDLTPDYMNILGQPTEAADKHAEAPASAEPNLQDPRPPLEDAQPPHAADELLAATATNVIPASAQYGANNPVAVANNPGVATNNPIIVTNSLVANDIPTETVTQPTETVTDTTAKGSDEGKELHSTPSRNDRFKVVKIASLEPFRRGRWKCMDYLDEAPPAGVIRIPQPSGNVQAPGGTYMQTQSLPQQQIQQMLIQGGFTNGTQFFQQQPQAVPQGQYFYQQMPGQNVPQQVPTSMPTQFVTHQAYFPVGAAQNTTGFVPQQYQNVQYVPANMINQNSAFVPTSQPVQMPANFQQSQTYAGQPNVSQPLVNGHGFTPQNEQQTGSLPAQTAKNVMQQQQPVASQTQLQNQMVQGNQSVPVMNQQQFQQAYQQPVPQSQSSQVAPQNLTPVQSQAAPQVAQVQSQTFEQGQASNIYTNPQFPTSANSLTVLDNSETTAEATESTSVVDATTESAEDLAKTHPVVNAIDNKIEQAMDLVKSHLMYTVREEVEVLKEKIAELMERIQQLETENNYLRSQIPKSQNVAAAPSSNPTSQPSALPANPSPNYVPSSSANSVTTPVSNPSHNPIPNAQGHSGAQGEAHNPQQQQQ